MGIVKRFLLPIAAIASCLFMVFAAVYAHGITPFLHAQEEGIFSFPVLFYLIVFVAFAVVGEIFRKPFKKNQAKTEEKAS